ncbi:MAG: YbaY family lipoprotein [Pseudomonadales bacterium]|nr:YbaY family lipoprotein [Pseudomonadales bacterium]MCP5331262.1 YbaY family lipoprotein [Pseudomonadales bacterium]MCP5344885.1 YbaY family lipoprotein [Pseudomonadales bacterium]
MMKSISPAFISALALMIAGCTTQPQSITPEVPLLQLQDKTISGQLSYRERIALVSGLTLRVMLMDVSKADVPASLVAEEIRVLAGEQVPLPFSITVKEQQLKTNMRYAVRATISSQSGSLLWTTDTVYPVDPDPTRLEQDLGTLTLVQSRQSRGQLP